MLPDPRIAGVVEWYLEVPELTVEVAVRDSRCCVRSLLALGLLYVWARIRSGWLGVVVEDPGCCS